MCCTGDVCVFHRNSTFESIPGTAVGILGMGEKACNPTCIDPIYNSIHESITWASDVFTLCFGYTTGVLAIGSNDRRFQVFQKTAVFCSEQRTSVHDAATERIRVHLRRSRPATEQPHVAERPIELRRDFEIEPKQNTIPQSALGAV